MAQSPTLRVARPTDDLEALRRFYQQGLELDIVCEFNDHDGIDGLMFGHPGAPYHLEFTCDRSHPVGKAPTQDNLLVFYLPERATWLGAVERMQPAGFSPVASANPYWDRQGVTFEDPDGYRVVLQNARWER